MGKPLTSFDRPQRLQNTQACSCIWYVFPANQLTSKPIKQGTENRSHSGTITARIIGSSLSDTFLLKSWYASFR